MCSADIFLGLLALLFPPLPVWVKCGICSVDSIINILLCMLGYIPGLIHAWYIIAKYPEPDYEYERLPHDSEHGGGERVTYVFVHSQPHHHGQPKYSGSSRCDGHHGNYGTASQGQGSVSAAASSSSRPAPPQPQPQPQQHPTQQGAASGGEGSSDGAPPPSYAQVVAGDHKVQTQD